jgi:inhibitor of cysteine peptidase
VDASYSGEQLELAIEDPYLTVTLPSNPGSTGFEWELTGITDETVIELTGYQFVPPADTALLGAPGKEIWTFKAVGEGESTVSMEYSQPWENGTKAAETLTLAVSVPASIPQEAEKQNVLNVSALLGNPVYDTEVKVFGKVSSLGQLNCPCFELGSGGDEVQVWYDLMVEDDGTTRPAVSMGGIENGDYVIVTGELKTEGAHTVLNDFWAAVIKK